MNLQPLLTATPAIQIHAFAALAALPLGAFVLLRRKGDANHRAAGRVWVVLMMVTALSGFFIHEIRLWGPFSPIHLLSAFVPVSLIYAIIMARKGKIAEHRKTMRSVFAGALLLAGLFTVMPGRIMDAVLLEPLPMPMQIAVTGALVAAALSAAWRMMRPAAGA